MAMTTKTSFEQLTGQVSNNPVSKFWIEGDANLPVNQKAIAWCQQGSQWYMTGHTDQSLQCFIQAANLISNLGGVYYAQAVCLAKMGNFETAIGLLQQEMSNPRSHPYAQTLLQDIQTWLSQYQKPEQIVSSPEIGMFTLFATPKPFLNPHITTIQRNAIKSWTLLRPRPEVILFGNEPGIAEIAQEFGLRHVPQIKCNEYGTPLADDVFAQAQSLAHHDLLVYINADIILTSHFMTAVQQVKTRFEKFLMVGQRWDANITTPLNFEALQWEHELLQSLPHLGTIHPPVGSDYFVFTKFLWPHVPPFAIGRAAWDIGMVYQALSHQLPVVDTSQVNLVIHQNHDYTHVSGGQNEVWKGIEAQRNYTLAGEAFSYKIGGEGKGYIAHANWELTSSGIQQRLEQSSTPSLTNQESFKKNHGVQRDVIPSSPLKIIVGASGSIPPPGWITTEQKDLDLLDLTHWNQYFSPASITAILAEHVWEHLTWEEGMIAAKNCYAYLAPGGYLRAAVPDGCHPHPQYIDWVKPHGKGPGAKDHKLLYTYQSFKEIFEQAGFQVELLEYFDEQGQFHFKEWDILGGMIYRSQRFDERNQGGTLNYTSIILDAKK